MPAPRSVDESATLSLTPGTMFQNWSTPRTVIVNAVPACCVVGVPSRPSTVPPRDCSPGTSTCTPASGPGFTAKLLLVPVCGGAEKSEAVIETAPPEPLKIIGPVHTPALNVTNSGTMLPGPGLAAAIASPGHV